MHHLPAGANLLTDIWGGIKLSPPTKYPTLHSMGEKYNTRQAPRWEHSHSARSCWCFGNQNLLGPHNLTGGCSINFDSQILVMPERSATLLVHMVEHLSFLSSARSFWITFDTSYDHGCHLARRLGLEPHDYEVLLIVAGLASFTRYGFKMKPTVWRTFLSSHHFAKLHPPP